MSSYEDEEDRACVVWLENETRKIETKKTIFKNSRLVVGGLSVEFFGNRADEEEARILGEAFFFNFLISTKSIFYIFFVLFRKSKNVYTCTITLQPTRRAFKSQEGSDCVIIEICRFEHNF